MKYFRIIFVTVITLFMINSVTVNAFNCPDGYSSTSKTITICGCPYQVDICYICYGVSLDFMVQVVGFGPVDDNCIPSFGCNILTAMYDKVVDPDFLNDVLCPNNLPPCSEGKIELEIPFYSCWFKYWDSYQGHVMWNPCENEAYCVYVYEICWDEILEEWDISIKSATPHNWPPTCTTTEPDDPGELDPPTGCFKGGYSTCE